MKLLHRIPSICSRSLKSNFSLVRITTQTHQLNFRVKNLSFFSFSFACFWPAEFRNWNHYFIHVKRLNISFRWARYSRECNSRSLTQLWMVLTSYSLHPSSRRELDGESPYFDSTCTRQSLAIGEWRQPMASQRTRRALQILSTPLCFIMCAKMRSSPRQPICTMNRVEINAQHHIRFIPGIIFYEQGTVSVAASTNCKHFVWLFYWFSSQWTKKPFFARRHLIAHHMLN